MTNPELNIETMLGRNGYIRQAIVETADKIQGDVDSLHLQGQLDANPASVSSILRELEDCRPGAAEITLKRAAEILKERRLLDSHVEIVEETEYSLT